MEPQDMNLYLLISKLPSPHLEYVLNENSIHWPVILNTKQLISSPNFIVVLKFAIIKQVIYIMHSHTAIYLVIFDNVLLFQAPKVLLNVEVTEATIMKPADANGM
jgi:hypothetical protein